MALASGVERQALNEYTRGNVTSAGARRTAGPRPGTDAGRRFAVGRGGRTDPRRGPVDDCLSLFPYLEQPVQHRRPGVVVAIIAVGQTS